MTNITVNFDDKQFEKLGEYVIAKLNLRKKENGRVDTDDGDKTPLGLGKTIVRYVFEHSL